MATWDVPGCVRVLFYIDSLQRIAAGCRVELAPKHVGRGGGGREHSATAERVESTESDQFRGLLYLREGHENRARTTPYAL
jgi:hypothetical protein